MLIDCDCCIARGGSCQDCVVTAILAGPRAGLAVEFDADERDAVGRLAAAGLVSPLRLVPLAIPRVESDSSGYGGGVRGIA